MLQTICGAMNKTYQKNIRRTLSSSLGRFFAIFSIVALGVGFLAGLVSTTPDMRDSVEQYLDAGNLYDLRVIGTLGLTQEDVAALQEIEGVDEVCGAWSADLLVKTPSSDQAVARVHSLPTDASGNPEGADTINRLQLEEGRWPTASGECVVEAGAGDLAQGLAIGTVLTVPADDNEDLADKLATTTFTVVGTVHDTTYFSFEREPASVGSGAVETVFYILPEDFSYDSYTMELIYVSDNNYYIMNQETGQYLSAERASSGGEETAENVKKTSSESKTEEDGTENETAAAWTPVWTAEPDETYGLFHFNRNTGSFAIQNTACRLFLAQNENRELVFVTNRQSDASHWRVSAAEKMLDKAQPMIFTQYDPQWCGTPYGGGGSMGTAGCGVLAAVNAVYSLSGQYMDVMELADYAVERNYRIVGSGTDDGIFKAACQKFGRKYNFAWDGKSGSIDVLKEKLQAGDVAIVHVQGHYVVIGAYSKKKDKYLLLDSNYLPKRATSAFGDWISVDRLLSGSLEVQSFYFYKLRDTAGNTGTQAQ